MLGGDRWGRARYDNLDQFYGGWNDFFATSFGTTCGVVVEYVGKAGGQYVHNDFRTNPAVASDLVLTVRYRSHSGAEHGRPLAHRGGVFWKIGDDYLQSAGGE